MLTVKFSPHRLTIILNNYDISIAYNRFNLIKIIRISKLISLQTHLIKIGARVVRQARTITLQLAKVAVNFHAPPIPV